MRKHLLLTVVFLSFFNIYRSYAKILRVGYLGKPVSGIDFTVLDNTVITAASAGDTIQLYQNNNISGSASVAKKLIFFGFGFLLDKNPNLQAVPVADYQINLTFNAGSEGSVVEGLNIANLNIAASNITIARCRLFGTVYLGYNGSSVPVSDITVYGNCFSSGGFGDIGTVTNLIVSNNIFGFNVILDNSSGLFSNNIMLSTAGNTLNSFVVQNNICQACIASSGSTFQNNLFAGSSCTGITGNGNLFGVNMSNVFVNWNAVSIAADNQLVLKTGSPAIGAGIGGNGSPTDAGIFGGDPGLVYKLSGIPPIPAIYKLSAPSQTASNNPYTITISVRSNN